MERHCDKTKDWREWRGWATRPGLALRLGPGNACSPRRSKLSAPRAAPASRQQAVRIPPCRWCQPLTRALGSRSCASRKCVDPANRGQADLLWRGLNPYNFYPLLSPDVPRHALCDICDSCHKPFISGMEGCTSSGRGLECLRCCPF